MRRTSSNDLRFYAAVAIGVVALCTFVVLRGRPRGAALAAPASDEIVPWCAAGLEAIPGGGCFAAPQGGARDLPVIVYLHGRYPPERASEELARQSTVARLATSRGYAVLALRGLQGECTQSDLTDWWCWPSNERNAADGPAFVARWSVAMAETERRVGKGPRWLLGFSNGGYFASLIASRALYPFDAIAVAHGGPVSPMHPVAERRPMLLVTADDDPSDDEMIRLDADLSRERWPHAFVSREGGHALPEWDVEMALTFFRRAQTEALPFKPPLQTRVRPPRDAGAEGGPEEPVAAAEVPAAGSAATLTAASESASAAPARPHAAAADAAVDETPAEE